MIRRGLKKIIPSGLWRDARYFRKWKFRRRNDWLKNLSFHNLWVFLKVIIGERLIVTEPLDADKNLYLSIKTTAELPRLIALKEPETVAWIKREVKKGDVFYDVGANVGAYSLLAAKAVGKEGMVYAFEPSSATFAALCKNIESNQLDQIIAFGFGLSNETRLALLHYSSTQSGAASHQ